MNQNEYNVSLIIFLLIFIAGNFFLASILLKEAKDLNWFKNFSTIYKCVIKIVSIVVAFVLVIYLVFSISLGVEEKQTVEIIDIVQNGSWAGVMDHYSLYVRDSKGQTFWVSSPVFAKEEFKKQLSDLKISETITIVYVENTQILYRIEN